jgi:ribosomal protein S6--L-glutamate ligase
MSRLAVLTATPDLPIYREVEAAGRAAGHDVLLLDALSLVASAQPPAVLLRAAALEPDAIAAVLPRVGNWRPDSTLAVLAAMRALGVPSLNEPDAIVRGRDHWLTVSALAAAGVPCVDTLAGADPESLAAAAAGRLRFPCVVKQRRSRQGVGVVRCASRAELDAVLDTFWRLGDEVVVQRFCAPGGRSLRVLVLDGEALGATEHVAAPEEFRSNAARGGQVRAADLADSLAQLAMIAARVVGLGFAGVDLFPDGERWLVGEVNPSPGWKHFAAATGVPVAARLVATLGRLGGVA